MELLNHFDRDFLKRENNDLFFSQTASVNGKSRVIKAFSWITLLGEPKKKYSYII